MRTITGYAGAADAPQATLTLIFERHVKARQRLSLDQGQDVLLDLPRGQALQDGDKLRTDDGLIVEVRAADESLSVARSTDPLMLARACYHLGNRHVALQIEVDTVSYLADHVLDAMVRQLGLTVESQHAPFRPETGAYGHHHG